MADLTTEEIAELRRLVGRYEVRPYSVGKALPALLDMAERCAKAEAELAAVNDSLREAGIGVGGKDGVEVLDEYLQMHRQDALRLSENLRQQQARRGEA